MVMLRLTAEQHRKLPVLVDERSCIGKTYIITGGNSSLVLETARHLVSTSAQCVVLAVRNLKAGEAAKADIEKTTGRKGVVQVRRAWPIAGFNEALTTFVYAGAPPDMSTYASVQTFAKEVSGDLGRVDGFVCNDGVYLDAWSQSEGIETSMFVNVVNTVFLGVLMMPKLRECAAIFGIKPALVFIVSVLGYTVKSELDKSNSRKGGHV
ncbi:hypothetical protein BDW74DRAFT_179801 [Aspergillus multicolor]|uniref:uncharacterized protein n=1 Tax=Aspergillus multicolor TaxID=41759 RepID=UPI003CCD536C